MKLYFGPFASDQTTPSTLLLNPQAEQKHSCNGHTITHSHHLGRHTDNDIHDHRHRHSEPSPLLRLPKPHYLAAPLLHHPTASHKPKLETIPKWPPHPSPHADRRRHRQSVRSGRLDSHHRASTTGVADFNFDFNFNFNIDVRRCRQG